MSWSRNFPRNRKQMARLLKFNKKLMKVSEIPKWRPRKHPNLFTSWRRYEESFPGKCSEYVKVKVLPGNVGEILKTHRALIL